MSEQRSILEITKLPSLVKTENTTTQLHALAKSAAEDHYLYCQSQVPQAEFLIVFVWAG